MSIYWNSSQWTLPHEGDVNFRSVLRRQFVLETNQLHSEKKKLCTNQVPRNLSLFVFLRIMLRNWLVN